MSLSDSIELSISGPINVSISGMSCSDAAEAKCPEMPSAIEREVMSLFEEFRDPLLRYAFSFGIPMHDAEEITQEVFLSLFRHLQLGRSRRNLRGWLFRVTHNLALKQRYKNKRLGDSMDHEEALVETQQDPLPNPEQMVSFAQRQRRLLAVVYALPDADQICLRLRAEGFRYREIAEIVGISLGSVSISLARSLARLMRADDAC
jgi:RNA polymerase sigma-70 factor (ECF subfamily)